MSYQHFPFENHAATRPAEKADDFVDLERLLHMALRQAKVVLVAAAIMLLLGIIYLQTTPPTYTSTARVLIDEELSKIVDEVSPLTVNMETDAAMLSQLEVLKSARLAGAVVDRLNLDENENFMNPPASLLSQVVGYARQVKSWILPRREPPQAETATAEGGEPRRSPERDQAIQTLQGNLRAERVGRSYVIAIAYESHDPRLAAEIARAYSQAYVNDQLNAGFDATEQAAVWLQGRLAELRENSQNAALEVEKYRAEHGLAASQGELIAQRRVADLTTQLIEAQAETADARARYEQYAAIVADGSTDAIQQAIENVIIPSELPAGSEIATLRNRYMNIVRRQREIETNFGADHQQAIALGREATDLAQQIGAELRQLTQTYRGEYEVAQAREGALRQNITDASGNSAEAGQAQVRLRELEQQASALSALYGAFLDRYEKTIQQQTFPVAKVRIISEALEPRSASAPRSTIVLGLSLILGLMAGASLGALNEFNERFFRTGEDVTDRLGFKFLGYLPLIGSGGIKPPRKRKAGKAGNAGLAVGNKPAVAALDRRALMRLALDAPSSMFAETLRNVKIASDVVLQKNAGKVLGVVSALPGEGKSTVAANLAQLLAANGSKTLLIDGDLRNPALTRGLGIGTDKGLVEAVVDAQSWRSLLKFDRHTRLAILPGVIRGEFSHTGEALSSPGMRRLIEEARGTFEYIIVDLPPLGPVVDAKAFAPLSDGFLVVVEWGRTPRALVRSILASEQVVSGKVLGVILNKVRLKSLPRYGSFGGSEQFLSKYAEYYHETSDAYEAPPKPPVTKTADVPAAQRPAAQ